MPEVMAYAGVFGRTLSSWGWLAVVFLPAVTFARWTRSGRCNQSAKWSA